MFPITLKPEKNHILGGALSGIPNDKAAVNNVEVKYDDFSKVIMGCDENQFLGPFVQALNVK